jgi:type VI secretion system protein ImpG
MPPVTAANLLLHCVPAVNLFAHEADPIRLDDRRLEYRVRPAGQDLDHFEVYTLDRISGLVQGTGKPVEFRPFFGFHRPPDSDVRFYRHYLEPSGRVEGSDVFLVPILGDPPGEGPRVEVLSLELTCTNRQLPSRLKVGDISVATPTSPAFARFRNIVRPTASVPPPLGGDLHWRLLSHMTLNYLSLVRLDTLRGILGLYHFRARVDRQAEHGLRQLLEGLKKVSTEPRTRLVGGVPFRGIEVDIEVDEENFAGEGEVYLFGSVLSEFFAQYVTLNAYSRLTVKGLKFREIHAWPMRVGDRILL